MNIPLGMLEIDRILGGGSALPTAADRIVLGMPHLCLGGLSETWLLKECGHRHWFMLAEATSRAVPDFRDAAGDPVYAAFVAVTVRDARFDAAREHDELGLDSQLARMSRTQFTSRHRCCVRGRDIGEIAMTSVFVKRTEAGRNRSIARVDVAGLPPVRPAPDLAAAAAMVAALRRDQWKAHLGFVRADAKTLSRFVIDPCPAQDFNGADFLYFASFQAFVDRAEWAFFRPDPRTTTRHRDLVFHGNIEPGDRVVVVLRAFRRSEGTLEHWCRLERMGDGAPLADVFTVRDT